MNIILNPFTGQPDFVGPAGGGGGGGDVATDSIWLAKGDLAAATGASAAVRIPVGTNGQILTANSGETAGVAWEDPPVSTGSPDRLALFNGDGDLSSLSEFAYNTSSFNGEQFTHLVVPTNAGDYQTLHSHYASVNPTVTDADQNWYMHFYEMSAGDDNSGNQVGDASNGSMLGLGMSVRSIQTSNVGQVNPFAAFISLGNGTDPMSGRNLTGYGFSASLATGGVTVENLYGLDVNFNAQAGSEVTNQAFGSFVHGNLNDVGDFFGSSLGVLVGGTVANQFVSYNAASTIGDAGTVTTYTDFNQQPSGTISNNYFSANFSPAIDDITGGYFGLNVNPNVAACAYADGLNINMSNVTASGQVRAAYFNGDVQIDGALSFSGALSISQINTFLASNIVSNGGNPTTINGLVSQFNGTGVVPNCDMINLSTPALVNLDATFAGTSGAFGLGVASLALPNIITMAAGCSLDNMTSAAYVNLFDATNTGGTIGRLIGCRSTNIPQGGTQTITRAYNFFADYFAGDVATDSWGFYDSGAKYNWMANALKIGAGDTTAYNFEVTGDSLFDGDVGFYGTTPVAQPTSSGPATAGGTYGATEQAMLQEVYDALRALGLMS